MTCQKHGATFKGHWCPQCTREAEEDRARRVYPQLNPQPEGGQESLSSYTER